MAIGITAGAWAAGSTSVAPALPSSPQAGDVHILYVGGKPYSTTINTPNGWTPIANTDGTNGTTANGTDVGSVHNAAFYRRWQSGDGNPTVSVTSGNVTLGVIIRVRPTAGSNIDDPVGGAGNDTSSGTGYSITVSPDPGITANDVLIHFTTIAGNNSTFGTPTITATSATIGTVTENPATEGTTQTGNDLESSSSTATCTAGTSSAAPVAGWTLSVAQTGRSNFIRIREHAPQTFTQTYSETWSASEAEVRKIKKIIAETWQATEAIPRKIKKVLADTWQASEAIKKQIEKEFTDACQIAESYSSRIVVIIKMAINETWQTSESFARKIGISIADTWQRSETFITSLTLKQLFTETWSASETMVERFIAKSVSAVTSVIGLFKRMFTQ